jgi:hypothetical protein
MQNFQNSRPVDSDAVKNLGGFLINNVKEIDRRCSRIWNGHEYGLCGVKAQVKQDIQEQICEAPPSGRSLKEEDSISWLLTLRARAQGIDIEAWKYYPGLMKTCDMVIHLDGVEVWVEVKLASKAYFNCEREINSNPVFLSYLFGANHRTHSAAQDISKLVSHAPQSASKALLLIGFDSSNRPMDSEIAQLIERECDSNWKVDGQFWLDRRNTKYRINVTVRPTP